jgi:hypothetical protein
MVTGLFAIPPLTDSFNAAPSSAVAVVAVGLMGVVGVMGAMGLEMGLEPELGL